MGKKVKWFVVVAVLVLSIVWLQSVGFAQDDKTPIRAPQNPAFIQYLEDVKSGRLIAQTVDGHGLGLIPPPIDLSAMKGQKVFSAEQMLALPTAYDRRTTGKLTNVKDQGSLGNCWAFATFGSLESGLLWYSAESCDFSEQNMKNLMSNAYPQGWDLAADSGGNYSMSAAYLSRWSGPLNESDDPYQNYSGTTVSPTNIPPRKHLQDMLILPDRSGPTDNDNIKTAVMYYGAAVYSSMYWDNGSYNPSNYAYYYNSSGLNHAICIVGWDDTFARTKFNIPNPPGDGAFIVRNSWGPLWGQAGYFYISYYDTIIGSNNAVFLFAEPTTNYGKVYQYDPLGWTSGLGYLGSTVAWGANIFTATADDTIAAVSFYAAMPYSTYTIYIYKNEGSTPRTGTLAATKSGTISAARYQTVVLDSTVTVTSGSKFSAVVQLITPGYNWPIPVESPDAGNSSKATANSGESWLSHYGTSWTDVTSSFRNTNVCLKVFMAPPAPHITSANNWQFYH